MSGTSDSHQRERVLRVAVPRPLRRLFDYLPPTGQKVTGFRPGCRIKVPFGRHVVTGFVAGTSEHSAIGREQLKPALAMLDSRPLLPPALLELVHWAADYYQHPIGEVFATALPAPLREGAPLHEEAEFWSAAAASAEQLPSRALRQRQLLEFLIERGSVSRADLALAGFSPALLRQLAGKGLARGELKRLDEETDWARPQPNATIRPAMNDDQASAVERFQKAGPGYRCALLNGITGSGKTEVYMRLIEQELAAGRQCLVLVPEIGLTPQTIDRFEQRFAAPVAAFHSGLNGNERLRVWRRVAAGGIAIVIGTRSAVFTPMARPGLIVIDEEHDSSFKQHEGLRYSARDLAVMRARKENIGIVLGSATPSLESFRNAELGRFLRLDLPRRAGGSRPALLRPLDIANQPLSAGICELAMMKIAQHLEAGNQVLVFVNRRGFAPILQCPLCGWTSQCEDCSVYLTVHSQPPCQRCHHCEARRAIPNRCPVCGNSDLQVSGLGTQQVEANLVREFPGTPVLRVDRDSTRGRDRFRKLLAQVIRGDPAILVGTQMLAKGHHFPGITLVLVVDADNGLFSPDFRGQEQMAQLIVQVAGRAGRSSGRPGEVLVQTRHARHETLKRIIDSSYSEFAQHLLAERRSAVMPPFSHLCLIRAECRDREAALSFLRRARRAIETPSEQQFVHWTGPLPAPLEKRQSRYRMQLLLRSPSRPRLRAVLARLVAQLDESAAPRGLRWQIDVDPIDLL